MRARPERAVRIGRDDARWPSGLARLGEDAPAGLSLVGNDALLAEDCLGLFCSVRVPGRLVIDAYEVARRLAAGGTTVIGGFQSPLEREVLDCLLRGSACAIVCPARSIHATRLDRRWRTAAEEGRLLFLSPFGEGIRRPTAKSSAFRNRVAAALASRLLLIHATPGGRLARLALEVSTWRIPLYCLGHPANDDLRLLGADPVMTRASTPG